MRLLVKQDILIKVEPVFMSTLVASYCQNNHLQASKNKFNDDKLCMISNQTFTIKFFISTLNVSLLSLVRSGHEAQIKSVKKTKFCFEVQML